MDLFDDLNWRHTKLLMSSFGAWPFQSRAKRLILGTTGHFMLESMLIPELKNLLMRVQRDWQLNLDESEIKILRNDGHNHKIFMDFYYISIYSAAVIYMLVPIIPKILDYIVPLNESRPSLPFYQAEYFVDPNKYSTIIYICSCLVTPITPTVFVAFDSIYSCLIQHSCSMFTIIGRRLQNLTNDLNISRNEKNDDDKFKLLTVIMANKLVDKIRIGWFGMCQVVHLYVLSYFGQKLIDHSEYIHKSVCLTHWYSFPHKTKPLIVLILLRCKILSKITAGKLYVMSVENFTSVMKKSISYFTVLTSVQ
ncbi:uncharacterized protein LOC128667980 [Microplitis demolitor]|uniref:uncharacterized protein LOC128667980 n=1 Tax=Microplitis demolitor TaxID=69319 RepID=UPI00235B6B5D|nr:uncharacterized protein LOC128667980 [Microplitis demolitor]